MHVFGRESIRSTAGEIKQNMGASPAYAYLAGTNFIRGSLFDVAAIVTSSLAQRLDSHFAAAMHTMNTHAMPALTPGETAVSLGIGALLTIGSISGLSGLFRGAESIITAPMKRFRRGTQA